MTGPEHYREAEDLLAQAAADYKAGKVQAAAHAREMAAVHASLARTALDALTEAEKKRYLPLDDQMRLSARQDEWRAIAS